MFKIQQTFHLTAAGTATGNYRLVFSICAQKAGYAMHSPIFSGLYNSARRLDIGEMTDSLAVKV